MSQTVSLSLLHSFPHTLHTLSLLSPSQKGPHGDGYWNPHLDGSFSCPGREPTGPCA